MSPLASAVPDLEQGRAPEIPGTWERWLEIDGIRIRYLIAGAGPPLLLVHGLLGYSFSWRHNIGPLSNVRTVYAIDLPGTGYGERSPGLDCGMRISAARLWRLLDLIGLGGVDLVGTSHGGALTIEMAAMSPQRVRSLVLVAPANPWSRFGRLRLLGLGNPFGAALLRMGRKALLKYSKRYFVARMYADPRKVTPETLRGYEGMVRIPGTIEYALRIVRTWRRDMRVLSESIKNVRGLPVLLIWGTADRVVDPVSAETLRANIPGSDLVMIEGAGHLPYEEVPEDFNSVVNRFLAKPCPGHGGDVNL